MTAGWKVAFALVVGCVTLAAHAQDMTVQEIKAQGARQLAAEDVKAALTGATLRYENAENATQVKLKADGSVDGSARRRVGSTGGGRSFSGTWKITDQGRWCFEAQSFGQGPGASAVCRDVFQLGDKYFYAAGNPKNDARPAIEMSVSK